MITKIEMSAAMPMLFKIIRVISIACLVAEHQSIRKDLEREKTIHRRTLTLHKRPMRLDCYPSQITSSSHRLSSHDDR